MRRAQDSFLSFTDGSEPAFGLGLSKSNASRMTFLTPKLCAMHTARSPSVNPPKSNTVFYGLDCVVRITGPLNRPAYSLTRSELSPWAWMNVSAPAALASS